MFEQEYEIGGIVPASEVPNWARRETKWGDLIERIEQLQPGSSLYVFFPDLKSAYNARNAVRDTINLEIGRAQIRTRVIKGENERDRVKVFFTMLRPSEIVENEE
jgi:hypothetical protein